MSHNKRFRANVIVWAMRKDLPTFEIRVKLADLGLDSFVRANVFWKGKLVGLIFTLKESRGLQKRVSQVLASLKKIGCRL